MRKRYLFTIQLTLLCLLFFTLSTDIKKQWWQLAIFVSLSSLFLFWYCNSLKKRLQFISQQGEKGGEILSQEKDKDLHPLIRNIEQIGAKVESQTQTLLEEKDEKEVILESLMEGVITFNEEDEISFINITACKFLGVSKRKILGKKICELSEFKNNEYIQKCCELIKKVQEKQELVKDFIHSKKDKKLYIDFIAAPKLQKKGVILVLQDKSNQQKMLQMGKDFIANASHELRTPITVIKGFAETLQDLPQISPQMLSQIIEKISRNCNRMETLVKNLLTLADIDNLPETKLQSCDVEAFIENCRESLLAVRPEVEIELNFPDEKLTVAADPDLLELAIMNLLENAAKYSPSPAQISVTAVKSKGMVELKIADKGIGIPKEDQEHIFERFYTVNKAHSRSLGGAGLGLSIVKTIIEKHDGTISLSSNVKGSVKTDPNKSGTTFIINLPKAN